MPLFEVETENHIVITWAEDSDAASAVDLGHSFQVPLRLPAMVRRRPVLWICFFRRPESGHRRPRQQTRKKPLLSPGRKKPQSRSRPAPCRYRWSPPTVRMRSLIPGPRSRRSGS